MADAFTIELPETAKRPTRNLLVTGARSGLGNAVYKALGGMPFMRGASTDDKAIRDAAPFDAIIHCAVNADKAVTMSSVYKYLDDNFLLTQRLVDIPHKKFVFVSSLAVYPLSGRAISETEDLDLLPLTGPYAFTKLFSDVYVQERATNPLILRTTTLLGPAIRPNTLLRALTQPDCQLFLAPTARYNCVLHADIVEFIAQAIDRNVCGAFNLGSKGLVVLSDVVDQLGLSVRYGKFPYDIGPVDTSKAGRVNPKFVAPCWEVLNRYIDSLGSAYIGNGRLGPQNAK